MAACPRCGLAAAEGARFCFACGSSLAGPAVGDLHAWHLYVVRLTDEAPIGRDAFIEAMYAAGIGCSVHYIPLHLQPYWRDRYGLTTAMFPHSQHAYERMVSLPLYTRMSDSDADRVCDTVARLLSR